MNNVSILHLSDVHFGHPDESNEHSNITDALTHSLQKEEIKTDLIIFTGDLTQRAAATEFQNAEDWLKKIQRIVGGKIVVCPGNHDMAQIKENNSALRLAYNTEESFRISKKHIHDEHPHMKVFTEWYKEACNNSDVFIKILEDNIFVDSKDISIKDIDMRLVALNTSVLSCEGDDERKLCIDIASLNSSLSKLDDNTLVISFGHHPLDWLTSWNATEVTRILRQEKSAHLYLHGHLHDEKYLGRHETDGSGISIFSAGAIYQGSKYPQSFSLIKINCKENSITPQVYTYSSASGTWDPCIQKSKTIPAALPSQCTKNNTSPKDNSSSSSDTTISETWKNPFDDVAANSLPSHIIPKLFVDENNFISRLNKSFESLIEGQRGTGKTMLLRYLSVGVVQAWLNDEGKDATLHEFQKRKLYTGIYTRLSNAGFNRSDFETVKNAARREALFLHRLSCTMLVEAVRACEPLVVTSKSELEVTQSIANYMKRLFDEDDFSKVTTWSSFCQLTSDVCDVSIRRIDEHLSSLLPGGTPTHFNPSFTLSSTLKSTLQRIYETLELTAPFFLLLDDFDTLNSEQQEFVFKTARERNHSLMCFKYGVMSFGQKSFMAGQGITYREGDDYDHIALQWNDRGLSRNIASQSNYRDTVLKIAMKRLEASNWPDSVVYSKLYGNWHHGNNIRKEVKKSARLEHEKNSVNNNGTTFTSLWSKQADSKYFRHLRHKKIEHRYAGLDTIIGLSSGIFRQFLELNWKIVTAALDRKWNPEGKKEIGSEVQNITIREYAEDMMRNLGRTSGDTSSILKCEFDITSDHLKTFTISLINFFESRLYGETKDGEVIAISIKGDLLDSSFAKTILDVAVRESILQKRNIDYPAKTRSQGQLPTYYLNRRLAPKGNLGYKMQGRHEISVEDVELAAINTKNFLSSVNKKYRQNNTDQGDLFND